MVYDLVKLYNKPHGAVRNKCMEGENPSADYCKKSSITILESINFDKQLGLLNSEGKIISQESEKYRVLFMSLLEKVKSGMKK
jgi:MinD superfamily P-loop ATPase